MTPTVFSSLSQEAICDLSINSAGAHAACTIVAFLGHARVGVIKYGAGEVGRAPAVRGRGRGCSSPEQVR